MRVFLSVLFFLVIAILGTALVLPSFIDWNKYKDKITTALNERLDYVVSLDGNVSFKILPNPSFTAENISVKDKASQKSIFQASKADIAVALLPLLEKEISISRLNLIGPELTLKKNKAGQYSLLGLGESVSEEIPQTNNESNPLKNFAISELRIENGKVTLLDDNKALLINGLSFQMAGLEGPFILNGDITFDDVPYKLAAQTQIIQSNTLPIEATIALGSGQTTLKYAGVINTKSLNDIQGQIDVTVKDLVDINIYFLKTSNMTLTAPLSASAILSSKENRIALTEGKFAVGQSQNTFKSVIDLANGQMSAIDVSAHITDLNEVEKAISLAKTAEKPKSIEGTTTTYLPADIAVPAMGALKLQLAVDAYNSGTTTLNDIRLTAEKPADGSVVSGLISAKMAGTSLQNTVSYKASVKEGLVNAVQFEATLTRLPITLLDASLQAEQKEMLSKLSITHFDASMVGKVTPKTVNLDSFTINADDISTQGTLALSDDKLGYHVVAKVPKFLRLQEFTKMPVNSPLMVMPLTINVKGDGKDFEDHDILANIELGKLEARADGNLLDKAFTVKVTHPEAPRFLETFLSWPRSTAENFKGAIDLYAGVKEDDKSYELSKGQFQIGGLRVQGSLIYPKAKTDDVVLDLETSNINLDEYFKTASAKPSVDSRWSRAAIDQAVFHGYNAQVSLKAKQLKYAEIDFSDVVLKAALKNGVLNLSEFSANALGGKFSGVGQITSSANVRDPLEITADMNIQNVALQSLSQAIFRRSYNRFSGIGDFTLKANATGISPATLILDLDGAGKVQAKDLTIQGFDLATMADKVSQKDYAGIVASTLVSKSLTAGQTKFSDVAIPFTISKGIAKIESSQFESSAVAVTAGGTIDFPSWLIDINGQTTFKRTDKVPPMGLSLTGNLDAPSLKFDSAGVEKLITDQVKSLIQKNANPQINQILDRVLGAPAPSLTGSAPSAVAPSPVPAAQQPPVVAPATNVVPEARTPSVVPQQAAPIETITPSKELIPDATQPAAENTGEWQPANPVETVPLPSDTWSLPAEETASPQ